MVRKPLAAKTVAVTRPAATAGPLERSLAAAGATVVKVPLIAVEPPSDGGVELRALGKRLDDFDWVVFTSSNGVTAFASVFVSQVPASLKWAAVGRATASALSALGVPVSLIPGREDSSGIAAQMPSPVPGQSVLLVQAESPASALDEELADRGWIVQKVAAYRTVAVDPSPSDLAWVAAADIVTLASPSAATNLARLGVRGVPVVCIGPRTAAASREHGLAVVGIADGPDPQAFTQAVIAAVGLGS